MQEMKKLAILNSKDGLHNKWGYMIIFSCMINITTGLQLVSPYDINFKSVVFQLGFGNLLLWWSLNKYLRFSKDYSSLPRVFISSSNAVFSGLAGVFPLIMGVSILSTIIMFRNFRFKDTITTIFTFFYMMQGDTFFDTGTNSNETNYLYSIFYYFLWTNFFGIFVIMNVTLAQVEDGYVNQKNITDFDFVNRKQVDPLYEQHLHEDQIMHSSITIPEAMRRMNMHLKSTSYMRDQNIQNQIKSLRQDEDQDDSTIHLKTISNMLEVEEYAQQQ